MRDVDLKYSSPGRHGRFNDVLDAAEFYALTYGSRTNALVQMVRGSKLYTDWRRREAKAAAKIASKASKRLRADSQSPS